MSQACKVEWPTSPFHPFCLLPGLAIASHHMHAIARLLIARSCVAVNCYSGGAVDILPVCNQGCYVGGEVCRFVRFVSCFASYNTTKCNASPLLCTCAWAASYTWLWRHLPFIISVPEHTCQNARLACSQRPH